MGIATLVFAGAHRLRYLITVTNPNADETTITTIGLPSPDTLTDSIGSGVIKQESKVVQQGYAQFAAGNQTTAQTRALWQEDYSGADPAPGSPFGEKLPPTAECSITRRSGPGDWSVDANIIPLGAASPTIVVSCTGGGDAYLDIESPGTIGA